MEIMICKLIKVENGYVLLVDNIMYATDNDLLSYKNCRKISLGYDIDELAEEETIENEYNSENSFKRGFLKALEIYRGEIPREIDHEWASDEIIESFYSDSSEWDVEIEMGYCEIEDGIVPKIDRNGCIIMKKIWKEN